MEVFVSELVERLREEGVIAVLVVDDPEDAVPVAESLISGGVRAVELTLRTESAWEVMRRIRLGVPGMRVGVGTILTPDQARRARDEGADFGVAPGLNPRVVQAALECGLSFAPGVCTPTDVELALEQGCRILKLFPAEPMGGLSYLRALGAPFLHRDVRFIPLGGLHSGNAAEYLSEASVLALGGSWLAPRDRILSRDWAGITESAREAVRLVAQVRGGGRDA